MSDQLDRDLRQHTRAIFESLPPVEDLLPPEMARDLGIRQSSAESGAFASPAHSAHRLRGWRVAIVAALVVVIAAIPAILWLTDPDGQVVGPESETTTVTSGPSPGVSTSITGNGTFSLDQGREVLEFSVSLFAGHEMADGSMPAIGELELRSASSVVPTWALDGAIVCVRLITERVGGQAMTGGWEVRYSVTSSNRPDFTEGEFASLYLQDAPDVQAAGEASTDPSNTSTCEARSGLRLDPLTSGGIEVTGP